MWYKYSRGLLTNPIPYLSKKFSPITYLNNERDKFSRKVDKIVNGPSAPSYSYQPQNNQRYQAQPFQQPFQNQQAQQPFQQRQVLQRQVQQGYNFTSSQQALQFINSLISSGQAQNLMNAMDLAVRMNVSINNVNIRNNSEMQAIYQREMSKQNYSKQGTIPANQNQPAQQYQMNFQVSQPQAVQQQTASSNLSTYFIRNAKIFITKLAQNPLDENAKQQLNLLIQAPEYKLQQSSIYPLISRLQQIYKELQMDEQNQELLEEAKKIFTRLSDM
jgi:hypothetical protein